VILRHTNGDIDNDATPRRKDVPVEHAGYHDGDTDIEFDSNVEPYKTPMALQKKKRLPVIELEDEDFQLPLKLNSKPIEKKRTKGQRPVADSATQVKEGSLT